MVKKEKHSKGKHAIAKLLTDVKEDLWFYVVDGSIIKNVMELADTLNIISDDSYYYHVTKDKNDFSNWVREVFKAEELADEIAKVKGRLETEVVVLRYLLKKFIG